MRLVGDSPRAALVLAAALAGCTPLVARVGAAPTADGEADIIRIHLQWSNAYLIKARQPVLIDSGSPGDQADLAQALWQEGLFPGALRLVVLTHGHADHAGLARWLQANGVPVALGAGDLALAAAGHNERIVPSGLLQRMVEPLIPAAYPPFQPDLVIADRLSLETWGIHGEVDAMPGHTPGSLVVLLGNGQAFAGDILLGGYWGGALVPGHAGPHYYEADPRANAANIQALLARGVQRFYLGHGGPVDETSVRRAFPSR